MAFKTKKEKNAYRAGILAGAKKRTNRRYRKRRY